MTFEEQKFIIRQVVSETPAPYKKTKWALKPDNDDPAQQAWLLVFYLENFANHTQPEQTSLVEWANVILTKINGMGIPCGVMRVE